MPGTQSWSRVPPSCFRVTNHHGTDVRTESGAYLSSDMPVAGFALIEARDADGRCAWWPPPRVRSPIESSR